MRKLTVEFQISAQPDHATEVTWPCSTTADKKMRYHRTETNRSLIGWFLLKFTKFLLNRHDRITFTANGLFYLSFTVHYIFSKLWSFIPPKNYFDCFYLLIFKFETLNLAAVFHKRDQSIHTDGKKIIVRLRVVRLNFSRGRNPCKALFHKSFSCTEPFFGWYEAFNLR